LDGKSERGKGGAQLLVRQLAARTERIDIAFLDADMGREPMQCRSAQSVRATIVHNTA
jgi:hypothetical protein